MAEVTYLFGAGASNGILPLSDQIKSNILEIETLFKTLCEDYPLDTKIIIDRKEYKKSESEIYDEILADFKWLQEIADSNKSIDSYAKRLAIRNRHEEWELLRRLKIIFALYLNLIQINGRYDPRYEVFLSALHTSQGFRDDLTILSWNYDLQFELAFHVLKPSRGIRPKRQELGIKVKGGRNINGRSRNRIYKLNGDCMFSSLRRRDEYLFIDVIDKIDKTSIKNLLTNYTLLKYFDHHETNLSFAWEEDYMENEENILHTILNRINDTIQLVVIGYSFPDFNKEIDIQLIGAMEKLETIYIQNPSPRTILEKLKIITKGRNIELVHYDDGLSTFFIP